VSFGALTGAIFAGPFYTFSAMVVFLVKDFEGEVFLLFVQV